MDRHFVEELAEREGSKEEEREGAMEGGEGGK